MYLPHIKYTERATRQMLSVFGGYNHHTVISEGEFYDMKNLTSDLYPVLSTRPPRKAYAAKADTVMWVGNQRVDISPPHVRINDGEHEIDLSLLSDTQHQIVVMGAYLVVFPEGKYVNLMKTEDYGDLVKERPLLREEDAVYDCALCCYNCDDQGEILTIEGAFDGNPADFVPPTQQYAWANVAGTRWYSVKESAVYQYVGLTEEITSQKDLKFEKEGGAYIRIYVHSFAATEQEREPSEIHWMEDLKDNDFVLFEHFPEGLDGKHILKKADQDKRAIIINGYVDTKTLKTIPLTDAEGIVSISPMPTVKFVIPPIDFVCSCKNRLWGCRYGLTHNGEFVNEIYATALGDIHRWYNLNDGENAYADNSWIASVGHMGPFTGAVSYGGQPYFFKSDRIYGVYGTDATTFGYTELVERGVMVGCDRSPCVVGGVLYYKSLEGVVAYDGSSTVLVSSPLGAVRYKDAAGGGMESKYYISMIDCDTEKPSLFVYDARRGLWHREDECRVTHFANDDAGNLWGIGVEAEKGEKKGKLYCFRDGSYKDDAIPWYAESGIMGLDDPDKKYISRLSLRLSLDVGAWLKVSIQYDSVGDFEQVLFYEGINLQTMTLPILPRRCDHMRIRFEGVGNVRIYALTKTIEGGSDL